MGSYGSGIVREVKMVENDCVPGVLSVIHLNTEERELFIDYMDNSKPYLNTDYLFAVLGDEHLLKFFDVFSGINMKIPNRVEILKTINYIKIYAYCKGNHFTEDSFESAAKVFGKRKMSIKRIVEKVERVLNGEEVFDATEIE